MRKTALLTVLCLCLLTGCEAPQHDPEQETDIIDSTAAEDFSMSNKIGATLRQALRDSSQAVIVLVKVDTAAAPDAAERLAAAGFEIRTRTGDIYTAQALPAAVRDVAELPFVISMQLSEER